MGGQGVASFLPGSMGGPSVPLGFSYTPLLDPVPCIRLQAVHVGVGADLDAIDQSTVLTRYGRPTTLM